MSESTHAYHSHYTHAMMMGLRIHTYIRLVPHYAHDSWWASFVTHTAESHSQHIVRYFLAHIADGSSSISGSVVVREGWAMWMGLWVASLCGYMAGLGCNGALRTLSIATPTTTTTTLSVDAPARTNTQCANNIIGMPPRSASIITHTYADSIIYATHEYVYILHNYSTVIHESVCAEPHEKIPTLRMRTGTLV